MRLIKIRLPTPKRMKVIDSVLPVADNERDATKSKEETTRRTHPTVAHYNIKRRGKNAVLTNLNAFVAD